MRLPAMAATLERRLLFNYRADPDVVARLLPAPLRPRLASGQAVVGICLIRLGDLRPAGLPAALGMRTENAAHRIAVEWDDGDGTRQGVYIPNRRSSSRLTALLGGRVFPGVHRRSAFTVREEGRDVEVAFHGGRGDDVTVDVGVRLVDGWPGGSVFGSLAEASAFFETGGAGYSATGDPGRLDGLELRSDEWAVEPAVVTRARSSFYADPRLFPPGSVQPDVALVMRRIAVTWHGLPDLAVAPEPLGTVVSRA